MHERVGFEAITAARAENGEGELLDILPDEALGLAYYDAAHFYHDFRAFMGMTPREYLSAPRPLMAAAAEAQQAAGITLSFELPPTIGAASERTSPIVQFG